MLYLLTASLLWACSFGLIKHRLGGVDAAFVAWVRLTLSALVFLPWLRLRGVSLPRAAALLGVGAVQYGLMYWAYVRSFGYLASHQVALLTIFTPLYVTLLADALERRFRRRFLLAAALAVAGAGLALGRGADWRIAGRGVWLVQISNVCFALGQVAYRRLGAPVGQGADWRSEGREFGLLYLGAAAVTSLAAGANAARVAAGLATGQWLTLLYLGLAPSALGFYLWNVGARRVSSGTLAAMNNAKIPLAVVCSLLIFGERAAWAGLAGGGLALAAAVWLGERGPERSNAKEG